MKTVAGFALVGALVMGASSVLAQAPATDPLAAGQRVFLACKTCHSLEAGGKDGAGPNLNGLFGKKAGTVSKGFNYSPALQAYGVVWTDATLDAYLMNPTKAVPGTKMVTRAPADPARRAALIAYLKASTR
ncbi:c-type cytochrome [Asticcacaulis sp. ZE23SCel15]|uniref:c-type cytochrome n=1 Tax=Asticcacaulis sp. ZE23SCel15 TaxID=3059027 RepID=UPI00265DA4BA|nr:c-type cytochrome [Asticcacaulis sp. ZE23SCel15]WKL55765.1 c-type cytochrome [Asticcacaulis sp. ZE23SCel15]